MFVLISRLEPYTTPDYNGTRPDDRTCTLFCFVGQRLFLKSVLLLLFPEFKFAFDKYSQRKIDSLGVEYDYYSVMHYGAKAFSKNGLPTIVARRPSVKTFGNTHLSVLDIKQANLLYKCPGVQYSSLYYHSVLTETKTENDIKCAIMSFIRF